MPNARAASSWRDVIKIHPAAEMFPLMTADELKALGEDIKKHGLKIPVTVWGGKREPLQLLDGRNRLDAMEAVGIPIKRLKVFIEYYCEESMLWENASQYVGADTDPYAYVLSANVNRRHLSAEQKRELIAKVLKAQPEKSNRQIAEEIKSNHHTVGAVRAELQSTGTISQLEKTVGKDGKARMRPRDHSPPVVKVALSRASSANGQPKPKPAAKAPPPDPPARALPPFDPGPSAAREVERLTARIAELENQKRLLELKITGLESEVEELKAQLAAARAQSSAPADDAIPGFLDRRAP